VYPDPRNTANNQLNKTCKWMNKWVGFNVLTIKQQKRGNTLNTKKLTITQTKMALLKTGKHKI